MKLVHIDGISGTGKTSLAEEFTRCGYSALDSDAAFGYYGNPETGETTDEQVQANWLLNLDKVKELAQSPGEDVIFVCGGAMNQDKVRKLFSRRFTLVIDDETIIQRLLNRTNNHFGKNPDDLARQLEWNKGTIDYAKSIGSIVVDSTRPIEKVADDILEQSGFSLTRQSN